MNKNKEIVLGIAIIIAATAALCFGFGVFGDFPMISVGQIVFLIIAVYVLVKGLMNRSIMSATVAAGYIGFTIASEVYHIEMNWALAAMITVAFALGFEKIFGKPSYTKWKRTVEVHGDEEYFYQYGSSDQQEKINVSFTEDSRYINDNNLQQVDVKVSFGEVRVFLNQSEIQEDFAVLNLKVDFGACTVFVPKTWQIENNLKGVFGGVEIQGLPQSDATKVLKIQGNFSFAGVEIIYI